MQSFCQASGVWRLTPKELASDENDVRLVSGLATGRDRDGTWQTLLSPRRPAIWDQWRRGAEDSGRQ